MLPDAVRQKANDYENCDPEIVREAIRTKGTISVGVPDKQTARGFSDECISYHASAEAGQSFVLIDGKRADLSLPETAEALKLDFTPNNACIKAVYAK